MDGKSISVLLVERDRHACKSISKILLSSSRIQAIDFVDNGLEAVAKATTKLPNVVLMNVSLETNVTGIYVCKEIQANVLNTKVVLYGEGCHKSIILLAFQMGAVNFLVDKYSKRELLQAVLDAADDSSPIHQTSADLLRREFKYIMDLQENQTYIMNVLVKLTPTEMVIPNSCLIRFRSSFAICSPVPMMPEPVTSSHASSKPNGSTWSVYSL